MSNQEQEAAINEAMHTGDWSGMAKNKPERRAMETVELLKCIKCENRMPCYSLAMQCLYPANGPDWQKVTATIHPQPEPEKEEVFEFGDRVEVYLCEKWMPGKFISDNSTGKWVLLDEDKTPGKINTSGQIRRPLRERMRKGQLVFFGPDSKHRIFKSFTGENCISVLGGEFGTIWRLPTRAELDEIGHSGKGWLTSDGGE